MDSHRNSGSKHRKSWLSDFERSTKTIFNSTYKEKLTHYFPENRTDLENYEEVVSKLKVDNSNFALLPLVEVDFRLKILNINGVSIWDDLENYKLKAIETYKKTEINSTLTDFNPKNIVRVGILAHLFQQGE